jgi:hypothetical protein
LGRLAKALAYLSICDLMSDEAEPHGQFLLIVRAKLDLRGHCCRDGLTIIRLRYVVKENKRGSRQATAGNCSQEERRNAEATLKKLNIEKQMAHKNKNKKIGALR